LGLPAGIFRLISYDSVRQDQDSKFPELLLLLKVMMMMMMMMNSARAEALSYSALDVFFEVFKPM